MTGQAIPADEAAERAALGAMMLSTDHAEVVKVGLDPSDFYWPVHQRLFACFTALRDEGTTPTVVAAKDWLRAHPNSVAVKPGVLEGLYVDAEVVGVRRHVEIVAELGARRAAMTRFDDGLRAARDPSVPLTEVADLAAQAMDAATLSAVHVAPGPGIDDWLAETPGEHDWVVPGYLERMERVLLTGWLEKGGKSVLLRQLAVQAACGCLWFTTTRRMEPRRVLFIDAENPPGITRRWFASLRSTAGADLDDQSRLVVRTRPEGLDLVQGRDRRWLLGLCEANRPDIIVLGPIYKLFVGNPNDEELVRALTVFLDLVRTRYRAALLLEAHTPNESPGVKRALRPIGSSVWRRWTDFGLGIDADTENRWKLVQWAPRDVRDWPAKLTRGGVWPWSDGTLTQQTLAPDHDVPPPEETF